MTENMVGVICVAEAFCVFIGCLVWLTNRRDERDAERLFFAETGKVPKRYLKWRITTEFTGGWGWAKMAEQIVWKVTFRDGSTCHFGEYGIAKAAARKTGVIEELRIKHAALSVVGTPTKNEIAAQLRKLACEMDDIAVDIDMDNDKLIDAAEARAATYDGDDRQDIKTDVMNAFFAGAKFGALNEREACAKVCDTEHFGVAHDDDLSWTGCAAMLADAIRTRSNA